MGKKSFGRGMERAVGEIVGGILTSAIVNAVIIAFSSVYGTAFAVFFIALYSALSTYVLIHKMPHWGTIYIIGWILGVVIIGYIDPLDATIYFVVSLIVLLMRFWKKLPDQEQENSEGKS